ncbi:MOSC domain-containing protein [Halalkalibacter sp. APA_J-10(15)]|uniref:MOSC domain-containing protein n=1 Tax=unclassified Halalkalibacter TaxID=2893063 RepID=UPI001FF3CAB0|nr:MOSC domain-containing protein [Halalkalibacter sp. APA_J-10(15)]MCK0473106.1 MOSC domain-containing protein [Halalkalibacter sp. APA_J-10(15)]
MYKIKSVNIGTVKVISDKSKKAINSGIMKESIENQEVFLFKHNLVGDEQADLINHGGEDKAVCIYPVDHLPYWENRYDQSFHYGAFGENVSIQGLTEELVYIGDQFLWGEAVVEVSQPRSPCFKVALKHGIKQLPLHIQETGYSGYYVRVIKEGIVSKKSPFQLQKKGSNFTVSEVNTITYRKEIDENKVNELLKCPMLSMAWKKTLVNKLNRKK